MSEHNNLRLQSLYQDLRDRYGDGDPVVGSIKAQIKNTAAGPESLPDGERRHKNSTGRFWNYRQGKEVPLYVSH